MGQYAEKKLEWASMQKKRVLEWASMQKTKIRMGQYAQQQKRPDTNSTGTSQKNETGDRKLESNDSPKIPDRKETSDTERRNRAVRASIHESI